MTNDTSTGNKATVEFLNVEAIDPFPPNANPMQEDAFHMGTSVGDDLFLLHRDHFSPGHIVDYLILVHKPSGKRVRLTFNREV